MTSCVADSPVEEWERSHQMLLARQRLLAQLEVRGAHDALSAERLRKLRSDVRELRAVVDRQFEAAFTPAY